MYLMLKGVIFGQSAFNHNMRKLFKLNSIKVFKKYITP